MNSTRTEFTQRGLRCTRQRLVLFDLLKGTKIHPTADELYHMVSDQNEHMSLATVYNTLEAFTEAGLCRKLPTVSGSVRYDADTTDHLHVRIRGSDRLQDVPVDLGDKLLRNLPHSVVKEIEEHLNVDIDAINIQLVGTPRSTSSS